MQSSIADFGMLKAVEQDKKRTLATVLPYILLMGGLIGFICSFIIMYEKLELLADPNYQPSCSLNPIVSCGNVMASKQSHVFGFPNPLIGIAAFPIVMTIGAAILAGARFKRWFWLCFQVGTIFGVSFITWLFFQSVYSIQALCPYCMVVWAVTIPIFWYTTLYNLREGHIKLPQKLASLASFLQRHHGDILLLWYLVIAGVILHHFWYFWKTLL